MNTKSFCIRVSDKSNKNNHNPVQTNRRANVAELYTQHAAELRELAVKIAGEHDADDAVHDAFLELLANPRRLPNRATLAAIVRGRARGMRHAANVLEPLVWPGEDNGEEVSS